MVPASAAPRANGYKTPSTPVMADTEPAASEAASQNDDDYVNVQVPLE